MRFSYRLFITAFILSAVTGTLYPQGVSFVRGESLFQQNRPEEAVPFLEAALREGDAPEETYVYLAVCYYQMRRFKESLEVCASGVKACDRSRKFLAYNAGNSALAMGDLAAAESWYGTAISFDADYAPPMLNRANTRLRAGKLEESISDYRKFLLLEPESGQRENIESLIPLIEAEAAKRRPPEPEILSEDEAVILVRGKDSPAVRRESLDAEDAPPLPQDGPEEVPPERIADDGGMDLDMAGSDEGDDAKSADGEPPASEAPASEVTAPASGAPAEK